MSCRARSKRVVLLLYVVARPPAGMFHEQTVTHVSSDTVGNAHGRTKVRATVGADRRDVTF